MKKTIFALLNFIVIASLSFTSCSKDDDEEPLNISKQSVNMVHGDTITITTNQKATFSSSNTFVATVSDNGKIEAKHVGQAVISASANGQIKQCTVTVKPVYNLYEEPILDFTLSKADILAKEKRTLEIDRDTALTYTDKKTYLMVYSFDKSTSKLKSATYGIPNISYVQSEVLADFLLERYQAIDVRGTESYFINSDSVNDATMLVQMSLKVSKTEVDAIVVYLHKEK